MTRKRFIIIVIVILLVIFLGLVIYNLFFKASPMSFFESGLSSLNDDFTTASLEPQPEAKFIQLTENPISNFKLVGENIILVTVNGSVKEVDYLGELKKDIGNFTLDNVLGAEISPLGKKAALLVSENSGQKERWLLFDDKSTRLRALASNTNWVSFSPKGELLMAQVKDDETSLVLKNDEGEKNIFTTNIPDVITTWSDNETITINTKPSGLSTGIFYLLDIGSKKITSIIGARNGLTTLMSNQKNRVLFSQTSSSGKNLLFKVLDVEKKEEKILPIKTLPEKCAFGQDSRFAYCAIFTQSPNIFIMPDDYYKGVFSDQVNDFVKINLVTGSTEIISRALPVDATRLELSGDESRLFFINKKDGNLYRLKIN